MSGECFRCGAPASNAFGNGYLCDECIPNGVSRTEDAEAAAGFIDSAE